ncbi:MAG: GNAT family N-acetyltransferase [Rhodobacteraceae bacterium]|nr:GNAT family N-acetyltransferase [Paracoccaceae bacterium]
MPDKGPEFHVKLVDSDSELRAAQALRYDVFVRELSGTGPLIDHEAGIEADWFDPFFDHMIATDTTTGQVIGVYRLLREDQARRAGRFYSEDEYDLTVLRQSGRHLLELGRSCVHPDYRGGIAMYHLWLGLAAYVADHNIDVLFGVASFHGTHIDALAQPLSYLHAAHLAPPELRVRAQSDHYQRMDLLPLDQIDRHRAMVETPALIKAYLRLGGCVGDGAFVDHGFNTTDVFLVVDTAQMNARQKRLYTAPRLA